MSYGSKTVQVHKNLRLDKRRGSSNWYARLTLPNGKREVKSTGTENLEDAKEAALKLYYEVNARLQNQLPASTRKFKHVAEHTIQRMQDDLDAGVGKVAYKDYISALHRHFIPYFGKIDVAKIDLAALASFDAWREKQLGRKPAQSTINNHNAALNRVLDEAELRGWINKSMRPTLLNKGVPTQARGSFTEPEYKAIYTALRSWHNKVQRREATDTRETLRNYVLFLANTGIRHGTEALGLRWKNLYWHNDTTGKYLVISVDGKTKGRAAIGRLSTARYLTRQLLLNPTLSFDTLDAAIASKSDAFVWTTGLGRLATVHSLNKHFNELLDDLDLKFGADNLPRTLYSLRHYYQTTDLMRGMSTHKLGKQVGTSTPMIDKFYSKVSPLANAYEHSGQAWLDSSRARKLTQQPPPTITTSKTAAFAMLKEGKLTQAQLVAALGVKRVGYEPTEEIILQALAAKAADLIDDNTLMEILDGQ
jgi:hypothetical protein